MGTRERIATQARGWRWSAHSPEIGFEHDLGRVQRAMADLDVRPPVVIDNHFAFLGAFGNRYWWRSTSSTAAGRSGSSTSFSQGA